MEEESKICQLPLRMKSSYEDKFKREKIVSNHYKIDVSGLEAVHLYRVDFEPKIDNEDRMRRNNLYKQSNEKIKGVINQPVFAGNIIFTTTKCSLGDQFSIPVDFEGSLYQMKLRLVKSVDFTKNDENTQLMQLHFLNNLLHTYMRKMNFFEIGKSRKFFSPKSKEKIENTDLMLYHGYSANFCRLATGLYLKVDAASKIVRKESVLDFIDAIYQRSQDLDKEEKRRLVGESLQNQTVMANYGSSRYWRVETVVYDQTVESIFPIDQKPQSLVDYYKSRYNIQIRSKKQPLLKCVNRTKIEVYLVPELCLMTGLPDNFDERKRREISKYTIRPPAERLNKIKDFRRRLDKDLEDLAPKQISHSLGITIKDEPTSLQSKVIPMPTVKLGSGERIPDGRQSNFRLFDKPLFDTDTPLKCCMIRFRDFDVSQMQRLFSNTAASMKIRFSLKDARLSEFSAKDGLDDILKELEYQAKKKEYNIFLVVLPAKLKTGYKKLKKMCCCDIGIPLQVVLDTISQKKQFQSIATKVLLQMAAKVGNTLWVPISKEPFAQSNIMLVGVNSSSQSASKKRIGVCATTNKYFSTYYSTTVVQDVNTNVVEQMQTLLLDCLNNYRSVNSQFPSEVIILRDGCNGRQVKTIKEIEVEECLKALRECKGNHISLTYILIDKRPTEKFFGSFDGQVSNPSAGTLINSQVVSDNYDFYLVSQFSNRGTTTPVYYNVVFSDSKMQEGKLAELMYSQCFGYANWSGSIKVPAPTQYAKKICEFTATNLAENEVKDINKLLYYI